MKKILCGVCAMLWFTAAQAQCSTSTYFINGKMITCSTCCYGTGAFRTCNTTCT